ncbi:MAG: ankyrin repeat domain-containing protein, partial [Rickettsiaceae bacterium]|nr:ankyrin repeat domain-containing protein [Rickettsiaceae bacterium]
MSQEKLIQAIWANNIDEVKKLIENHEADPNQPARFGDTPLHGACRGDHIEIAQFLIENGANPNQPDESGETPLHYACERGHREIAKLLIENGVNVNYNDNYGKTPLYSACYQGYTEIAEFLIKHGANVNQLDNWGRTPLHFPSFWGHTEIAKLLMEHGANVNATDFSGKTPLHNACTLSKEEWREFLIENGAKVSDYMVSGAYNIPETMPHIRAAQWCQDALAEEPVYGVMPEGVNLELLQKVMKGQLVEEGSIDKLNAFAVADNPITNQIKAGTFIEDTTNAILEKYAKRLYKNILSGTPHDVETLDTLPQEMQEFVVEKVKELCLENGIVSYENAKTALNSVNIPYYMREEMRKTLDESRSIFEVIEG